MMEDMVMKAKRCYSLFLVLALCLSLFPISAAAEEVIEYNLWVSGTQVTSRNAGDVFGNGKVSYNPEQNTLTLNGANITKDVNTAIREDKPEVCGVYYKISKPLTVNLIGENSITSTFSATGEGFCYGFLSHYNQDVTFKGNGKLTVTAGNEDESDKGCFQYTGIKINGATVIKEGTTVAAIAKSGASQTNGLYNEGSLTVKGKLTGSAGSANYHSRGIRTNAGMIVEENAVVEAQAGSGRSSYGLECFFGSGNCLVVNGGSLEATAGTAYRPTGENYPAVSCGIYGRSPDSSSYGIVINGGKVVATASKASGFVDKIISRAIWCHKIDINGAIVKATGGEAENQKNDYVYSESSGIWSDKDVLIGGNAVVNATGGNATCTSAGTRGSAVSAGIKAFTEREYENYTVLIEGNAAVNTAAGKATSTGGQSNKSLGIYSDLVTVEGGVLKTTGGEAGISYGICYKHENISEITVKGGDVTATGYSGALSTKPVLGDGVTADGSENIDGSNPVIYNSDNNDNYKWFKSSATASSNGEPPSPPPQVPSGKEATPNVSFEAIDEVSGLLSGMVPNSIYNVSGATDAGFGVSDSGKVVLGDLRAGDLYIVKKGNPPQTTDSEAQIIEIRKADAPTTVNALACTNSDNNNGKLQNVNATMEYKPATQVGGPWTKITGTEVSGLNAGSYEVRVRASGTTLASGNQVVTVEKYVAPPLSPGSSGSGSGKHSHTVQKETQKAQISYGENKENIDIKTDKQKGSALVELKDIKSASGKAIVVNMPKIKDIVKNILSVDVSQLLKKNDDSSITMETDIAVVSLPSNMLTDVEKITGNRAELSVAKVKKSDLPERAKEKIGIRPVVALTISIDHRVLKWRSEATAVKVTIPYIPTAHELEHPERITAYYIDENGNFLEVEGARYDKERKGVVFSTNHFSYYTVGYKEEVANEKGDLNFSDVTASDWYYEAVKYITEKGITKGVGDGKFGAHQALTRGQFIVMFMRAYGIEADTENVDNFSDAGDTYYTNYLAKAKKLGIAKGVGDNKFAPEKAISREEMFTLLYNGLKVMNKLPDEKNEKDLSDFGDKAEVSEWAKEAMTSLVKNGVVAGTNGKLKPAEGANRAEMAQVMYNLMASK